MDSSCACTFTSTFTFTCTLTFIRCRRPTMAGGPLSAASGAIVLNPALLAAMALALATSSTTPTTPTLRLGCIARWAQYSREVC